MSVRNFKLADFQTLRICPLYWYLILGLGNIYSNLELSECISVGSK